MLHIVGEIEEALRLISVMLILNVASIKYIIVYGFNHPGFLLLSLLLVPTSIVIIGYL
jgi:hypothetical protein